MTVTVCEHCQVPLGAPHRPLETDCVLGHAADPSPHVKRDIGLICRRHYGWINNTLTQLEELFALRGDVIQSGSGGDGRVGNSVESAAPGRLGVMALTDHRRGNLLSQFWREDPDAIPDVPGVLESWLRLVDEESGHNLLPFGRADYAVDRRGVCAPASECTWWRIPWTVMIRLLRRERHWIAQQLWVDDYASDLADLHLVLARGVGDSMWPRSIGLCPNCANRLFNTIGLDSVTCRRCRTAWSGIALVRLRLILEQDGTG